MSAGVRERGTEIVSTGSYLPARVVTNDMLAQFPPAARALIEAKTGVRERRFAREDEAASDLAAAAAADCLSRAGFDPLRLGAIILATSSPDRIQPATATRVQHALGARNAFAFDVGSVCCGFVYGLALADALVRSGTCAHVLVVAAEVYSKILNPADFATYPYFGDGAAAALLRAGREGGGSISSLLRTDGSGADVIQIPAGGSRMPFGSRKRDADLYFQMRGREVFDFAVTQGTAVIGEILARQGVDRDRVKRVVPHQANLHIIREIAARSGIDLAKFLVNLDRYGNTAGASVALGLDELFRAGELRAGDLVLTVAFGGGLSWGANLIVV